MNRGLYTRTSRSRRAPPLDEFDDGGTRRRPERLSRLDNLPILSAERALVDVRCVPPLVIDAGVAPIARDQKVDDISTHLDQMIR